MATVNVRELRNHGGEVLDRVAAGESMIISRSGEDVAELHPLRRRAVSANELIRRRAALPVVDGEALRRDLDAILDPTI